MAEKKGKEKEEKKKQRAVESFFLKVLLNEVQKEAGGIDPLSRRPVGFLLQIDGGGRELAPLRSTVSTRGSTQIENVALEGLRRASGGDWESWCFKFIFDQEVKEPDVDISSQVEKRAVRTKLHILPVFLNLFSAEKNKRNILYLLCLLLTFFYPFKPKK